MFQGLIFVLAVSLMTNESPQSFFGECPDTYTGFCFHGTCRFLVSEWEASCLCLRGYMGNRCEYVDLLQVMTGDPRTFTIVALAVTFLVVLTVIGTTCLGVYLYRIKRDKRLALLNNMDIQDV